jgi:peroxiredoxin Q/BCP
LTVQLKVGDKAPDFCLSDQDGREVCLDDCRGRKLLLYFYPKADTPGCTKQACSVRDALEELAEIGVTPIGISPDQPGKQKKFDTKHGLGFPLLSDPESKVARAYGAWGKKSMYGKTYEGIIRSSFLIDEEGKIIQLSYRVKPQDTVYNAKKALG